MRRRTETPITRRYQCLPVFRALRTQSSWPDRTGSRNTKPPGKVTGSGRRSATKSRSLGQQRAFGNKANNRPSNYPQTRSRQLCRRHPCCVLAIDDAPGIAWCRTCSATSGGFPTNLFPHSILCSPPHFPSSQRLPQLGASLFFVFFCQF